MHTRDQITVPGAQTGARRASCMCSVLCACLSTAVTQQLRHTTEHQHHITHSATNRGTFRYVTTALRCSRQRCLPLLLQLFASFSLPSKANMRTLTNNSDDVIIRGFQDIPGPGASHDFQCAGAGGDQQNTWSNITLKFQQPHRFQ